ncbi:MAG: hypothetical protein AAGL98_04270, partial [Planctomycetota bacterium]
MSPLTKALVLLVTVLSIVLVALVVPFVANTDDLEGEIAVLEQQLTGAQVQAKAAAAERDQIAATRSESQSELQRRVEGLLGDNTTLAADKAALEGQLKEAQSNVDKLGASLALMTGTQEQLTALLDQSTDSLETSQTSNVDLKKENAQLAQRNNDLDAQVTGLTRTVRSLNEKVVDLQEQLAGGGFGSSDNVATASAYRGPEIRGAVTGTQQIEDIVLISLNVGANDSVSPNTKFVIF